MIFVLVFLYAAGISMLIAILIMGIAKMIGAPIPHLAWWLLLWPAVPVMLVVVQDWSVRASNARAAESATENLEVVLQEFGALESEYIGSRASRRCGSAAARLTHSTIDEQFDSGGTVLVGYFASVRLPKDPDDLLAAVTQTFEERGWRMGAQAHEDGARIEGRAGELTVRLHLDHERLVVRSWNSVDCADFYWLDE